MQCAERQRVGEWWERESGGVREREREWGSGGGRGLGEVCPYQQNMATLMLTVQMMQMIRGCFSLSKLRGEVVEKE